MKTTDLYTKIVLTTIAIMLTGILFKNVNLFQEVKGEVKTISDYYNIDDVYYKVEEIKSDLEKVKKQVDEIYESESDIKDKLDDIESNTFGNICISCP